MSMFTLAVPHEKFHHIDCAHRLEWEYRYAFSNCKHVNIVNAFTDWQHKHSAQCTLGEAHMFSESGAMLTGANHYAIRDKHVMHNVITFPSHSVFICTAKIKKHITEKLFSCK